MFSRHRFVNRFTREYRLYGFTGDIATKIRCSIFRDAQVTNTFTTFYTIYTVMKTRIAARSTTRRNTNMLNIHFEILITRCQSATIITNVNVTNTSNSISALLVPGLRRTSNFFVGTGLTILDKGLPALLHFRTPHPPGVRVRATVKLSAAFFHESHQ